jgi:hypothetical protein
VAEKDVPRFSRGKRPHFFDDPAVDQLLGIVLGLTQEVAVLRDRVDTIERVMDRNGTVSRADIEAFIPDAPAVAERAKVRAEYLGRVFRVLQHEAGTYSSAESEQHVGSVESALGSATT